ncbi:hypothetical protein BKA70DRAFT_1435403 [Coprinopsis sp. MPI-PUGE-AT-0042]|nr:hypothetical protein BKA70DRAFT_1435403 [Coprinopsis sp. MPI-PUGE-AT-0042]
MDFPSNQFTPLLSSYQLLTTLDLRCGPVGWDLYFDSTPITVDCLTSFSFTAEITPPTMTLLQRFRMPSLSHFNLTLYGGEWDGDEESDEEVEESGLLATSEATEITSVDDRESVDPVYLERTGETYASFVKPLFRACQNRLTSFTLKGNFGPDVARGILSVLPSAIAHFHLQYWPYSSSFVDSPPLFQPLSSTPPSESIVWLPNLETMRVFEVPSPHMSRAFGLKSVNSLVGFSKARVGSAASYSRLTSLGVTRGSGLFPDADFEGLGSKGLKVTCKNCTGNDLEAPASRYRGPAGSTELEVEWEFI